MEILSFYRNGKLGEFLEIETLCFPRDGKLGDFFFRDGNFKSF